MKIAIFAKTHNTMRTIDVIIKGELNYIDYSTQEDYERNEESDWDDDFNLEYDSMMLLEPYSIEVEGKVYEQEDGEYPWTRKWTPMLTHLFGCYGFPEESIHMWVVRNDETCVYKLKLEDNEEFDIQKLTLIHPFELNMFEDSCLYGHIEYNGKKLEMEDDEDDNHCECVMGNCRAWEYEIEEFENEMSPDDPDYIPVPKDYC